MLRAVSCRVLQSGARLNEFSTRRVEQIARFSFSINCKPALQTIECRRPKHTFLPKHGQKHSKHKYRHLNLMLPCLTLMAAAINQTDKDSEHDNQDVLELLAKAKKMLNTKCSYESVEKVYNEALHIALSRNDKKLIAYVQDQYANLALRHNKLEESEKLFKSTIRNLLDIGMKENDVAILEISLKLSMIYGGRGNDNFATSGYIWVIKTSKDNLSEIEKKDLKIVKNKLEYENQLALLGMALDSYGRYCITKGRLKEALDVTREAAEISIKLFGENDIRTLVIFNDIGAILNQLGKYDEAVQTLEKVIKIAKKSGAMEHSDIAVFCANLGSILCKQGDKEKAMKIFEKARNEAEKSKDKSLIKQIEFSVSKSKAFGTLTS